MSLVIVERSADVMDVTLNRPERRNALDLDTMLALDVAISDLPASGARAVLIHGAGSHFSAGADLRQASDILDSDWNDLDRMLSVFRRIVTGLRQLPLAVVCAAEGCAVGAGAALALAADVLVVGPTARLSIGTLKLGMTPDGGLSFLLGRALGGSKLVSMALLGSDLDATALLSHGLAAEVTDDGAAVPRGREIAGLLARTVPPLALVGLRELADRASMQELPEQFELESAWVRSLRQTADFREGVSAFLERRQPAFKGR